MNLLFLSISTMCFFTFDGLRCFNHSLLTKFSFSSWNPRKLAGEWWKPQFLSISMRWLNVLLDFTAVFSPMNPSFWWWMLVKHSEHSPMNRGIASQGDPSCAGRAWPGESYGETTTERGGTAAGQISRYRVLIQGNDRTIGFKGNGWNGRYHVFPQQQNALGSQPT